MTESAAGNAGRSFVGSRRRVEQISMERLGHDGFVSDVQGHHYFRYRGV